MFTYSNWPSKATDAARAQQVVGETSSQIIDESLRDQASREYATTQFLKDEIEGVGKKWSELDVKVKATPPSTPQYSLLVMERDQRRREYEWLMEKNAQAEVAKDLAARKQDQVLELLDPATLPAAPDNSPWPSRVMGLACGLALWAFFEVRRSR